MKLASRQTIYLFVFFICMGSSASHAGCSELQGVTLCDNGDRKLVFDDVTYTSTAGKLTIRSTETHITDLYSYGGYHQVRCYRQNTSHRQANHCYSFLPYYGETAGQ